MGNDLPSCPSSPPHPISATFPLIDDATEPFEEEGTDVYKMGLFYPVHIGQILIGRYRILRKMGCGSRSTALFCRDLQ